MAPQETAQEIAQETTTVCVVGGGPAGAMLALLLTRAGVDTVLLEKHADFLRDFRGDTVHPSTMEVLDEVGLAERFLEIPHRKLPTLSLVQNGVEAEVADFRKLKLRFPYIVLVPQWDFLNLITSEAARYPGFRLRMRTAATGLLQEDGRVVGVRAEGPDGLLEIRAGLVVAADGRKSVLRESAGLTPFDLNLPMDVMMFRIERRDSDPDEGLSVRFGNGGIVGVINRNTYWQMSYETAAGGYERLKSEGVDKLRKDMAELVPFMADRTHEVGLDDLRLLEVRVDRLKEWHKPGLLFIGDSAHAMSPAGGSGVNLAVQDAVATANILAEALLEYQRSGKPVEDRLLAAIRKRRWMPTIVTQAIQRALHRVAVPRALRGEKVLGPHPGTVFKWVPGLQRLNSRLTGVGPRPEHVRIRLTARPISETSETASG